MVLMINSKRSGNKLINSPFLQGRIMYPPHGYLLVSANNVYDQQYQEVGTSHIRLTFLLGRIFLLSSLCLPCLVRPNQALCGLDVRLGFDSSSVHTSGENPDCGLLQLISSISHIQVSSVGVVASFNVWGLCKASNCILVKGGVKRGRQPKKETKMKTPVEVCQKWVPGSWLNKE